MLPIQVLLVEDNPGDARLVRELLGEEEGRFVVDHAGSLGAACERLSAGTSDVVLLDLSLPDSQGFGTISSIRARASHLPLIVLTGFDDADFAVEAVKAGAQDFLVKGQFEGGTIRRAIRYAITRRSLEERVRLSEERLKGIIELAHDGIVVIDEGHRISLFNPAAERLFGYRADEVLGRSLDLLLPERSRQVHRRHVERFAGTGRGSSAMTERPAVTGLRRDGTEFAAEVSISHFASPGGRLFTAVVRDTTDRRRAEEELLRLATTDALTGAANRRHFLERAELELARLRRYGGPVSLVMLDVDHFKRVNDLHGHAAGDAALILLVKSCRCMLRDTDLVGRLGGEEFALLLVDATDQDALRIAERVRRNLADLEVAADDGTGFGITVSMGVAGCRSGDTSIEQPLGRADRALYHAKATGRDRTVVAP
ncbi:diguanylate cyclase [Skermanella sp. TT6]|uniref:diguanylate cyclase n=1 Tax=Skermanella cutis TaxID=2775420 RepID=A0ABX7B456_9PROT|nr:diguanylate cyclase [Skermanella sp. TT6]QQP88898.1 diguanylate cyclase [Skermanella sp. TT6]